MSLINWFSKKASQSSPSQDSQTFILEPILTPSGFVDGLEETPDAIPLEEVELPELDTEITEIDEITDLPEPEETSPEDAEIAFVSDSDNLESIIPETLIPEEELEEIEFITTLNSEEIEEPSDEPENTSKALDVDIDDSPEKVEAQVLTLDTQETEIEPDDSSTDEAIADQETEPIEHLAQPKPNFEFDSGLFTVGETGEIEVEYLFDGGKYQGELAFFSLEGMNNLEPGSEEFIQNAAERSLSDSEMGHIVISDKTEGALFEVGEGETNWNRGEDQGTKTVQMRPGDTFGVMLVPNKTVQNVFDNPSIGGAGRPLFSLVTSNPEDGFHVGQIADVTGDGQTFVLEDLRVDGNSDYDYNDIIFRIKGATGQAINLDEVIDTENDWRETELGQQILDYIKPEPLEIISDIESVILSPEQPTEVIELSDIFAIPEDETVTYELVEGGDVTEPLPDDVAVIPGIEETNPTVLDAPASLEGDRLQINPQPETDITDITKIAVRAVSETGETAIHTIEVVNNNISTESVEALNTGLEKVQAALNENPDNLIEALENPELLPVVEEIFTQLENNFGTIYNVLERPDILEQVGVSPEATQLFASIIDNPELGELFGLPASFQDTFTNEDFTQWDNHLINAQDAASLILPDAPDIPVAFIDFAGDHGEDVTEIFESVNPNNEYETLALEQNNWAQQLITYIDNLRDDAGLPTTTDIENTDNISNPAPTENGNVRGNVRGIVNLSFDLTQIDDNGQITTRYQLTPEEQLALQYARDNNILLVVASGNTGDAMSGLGQAANEFDNIITVGAINPTEEIADYSSRGETLTLVAPGGEHKNNPEAFVGTSRATSYVTGAASLVWQANPELNYQQVKEILTQTAKDLGEEGWDTQSGAGLLNVTEAVLMAGLIAPEEAVKSENIDVRHFTGEGRVTTQTRAAGEATEQAIQALTDTQNQLLQQWQTLSDLGNPDLTLEDLQKALAEQKTQALERYQQVDTDAAISLVESEQLADALTLATRHHQLELGRLQTFQTRQQDLNEQLAALKTEREQAVEGNAEQIKLLEEAIAQSKEAVKDALAKLQYQLVDPDTLLADPDAVQAEIDKLKAKIAEYQQKSAALRATASGFHQQGAQHRQTQQHHINIANNSWTTTRTFCGRTLRTQNTAQYNRHMALANQAGKNAYSADTQGYILSTNAAKIDQLAAQMNHQTDVLGGYQQLVQNNNQLLAQLTGESQDAAQILKALQEQAAQKTKLAEKYWHKAALAEQRRKQNQNTADYHNRLYQRNGKFSCGRHPKHIGPRDQAQYQAHLAENERRVFEQWARQAQTEADNLNQQAQALAERVADWPELKQGIEYEINANQQQLQAEKDLLALQTPVQRQQLETLDLQIQQAEEELAKLEGEQLPSQENKASATETRLTDLQEKSKVNREERKTTQQDLQTFLETYGYLLPYPERLQAIKKQIQQLEEEKIRAQELLIQLGNAVATNPDLVEQFEAVQAYISDIDEQLDWAKLQEDQINWSAPQSPQRLALAKLIEELEQRRDNLPETNSLPLQDYIDFLREMENRSTSFLNGFDDLQERLDAAQAEQTDANETLELLQGEYRQLGLEKAEIEEEKLIEKQVELWQEKIDQEQEVLNGYQTQIRDAHAVATNWENQRHHHQNSANYWNGQIHTQVFRGWFFGRPFYFPVYNHQAEANRNAAQAAANNAAHQRNLATQKAKELESTLQPSIQESEQKLANLKETQAQFTDIQAINAEAGLEDAIALKNQDIADTNTAIRITQEEIKVLEHHLAQAEQSKVVQEGLISDKEHQIDQIKSEIAETEGKIANSETGKQELEAEKAAQETQLANQEQALENLKIELSEVEDKITEINSDIAANEVKIEDLQARRETHQEERDYFQSTLDEVNQRIADKEVEIADKYREIELTDNYLRQMNTEVARLENRVTVLNEADALESDYQNAAEAWQKALENQVTATEELVEIRKQGEEDRQALLGLQSDLAETQTNLAEVTAEQEELQAEVADARQDLAFTEHQLRTQELQLYSLRAQDAPLRSAEGYYYGQAQYHRQRMWYWNGHTYAYHAGHAAAYRHNLQKASRLAEQRNNLWPKIQETEAKIAELRGEIPAKTAEVNRTQAALAEVTPKVTQLTAEVARIEGDMAPIVARLKPLQEAEKAKLAAFQNAVNEATNAADELAQTTSEQAEALQRMISFGVLGTESDVDFFATEVEPKVNEFIEQLEARSRELTAELDNLNGVISDWEDELRRTPIVGANGRFASRHETPLQALIDETTIQRDRLLTRQQDNNDIIATLSTRLQEATNAIQPLRQQQELEIRQQLETNDERLAALERQLETEEATETALSEDTILAYAQLGDRLRQDLSDAAKVWTEQLLEGHQQTIEIGERHQELSQSVDDLVAYIEEKLGEIDGERDRTLADLRDTITTLEVVAPRSDELEQGQTTLTQEIDKLKQWIEQDAKLWEEIQSISERYALRDIKAVFDNNLIRNGSFEDVEGVTGVTKGQGALPRHWINVFAYWHGADTYSEDNSFGLNSGAYGNFPTESEAQDGSQWVAGASAHYESFAQKLETPLKPGEVYELSAYLKRSLHPHPGGYEIFLADGTGLKSKIPLGTLEPTDNPDEWERRSFSFIAPEMARTHPYIVFNPISSSPSHSYPAIDNISLTLAIEDEAEEKVIPVAQELVDNGTGNPADGEKLEDLQHHLEAFENINSQQEETEAKANQLRQDWADSINFNPDKIVRTQFDNKLIEAVRADDNHTYTRYSTNGGETWNNWVINNLHSKADDMKFTEVGGKLYQVIRMTDNHLYVRHTVNGKDWTGWSHIGGTAAGEFNLDAIGDRIVVSMRHDGTNNKVYTRALNANNWQPWNAAPIKSLDDIQQDVIDGRLIQSFKGIDGNTYLRHTKDGTDWTEWTPVEEALDQAQWRRNEIAEVATHTGNLELEDVISTEFNGRIVQLVRDGGDTNEYVYQRVSTDDGETWTDWQYASIRSNPDEIKTLATEDRLFQVVRHPNNIVYVRHSTDGENWSGWITSTWGTTGNFEADIIDRKLVLTVRDSNTNHIDTRAFDGHHWETWQRSEHPALQGFTQEVVDDRLIQTYRGLNDIVYTRHTTDGVEWTDWTPMDEMLATSEWEQEHVPGVKTTSENLHPKDLIRTEFDNKLVEVSLSPDNWMYQRYSTDGGETWTEWKPENTHVQEGKVRFFHVGDKLFQVQKNQNNHVYFRYSTDGENWTSWNNADLRTITGDYKADIVDETLVISGLNYNDLIYSRPIVNGVEQTRTNSSVATIADYEQEVDGDRIIQTYRGVDNSLYSRESTDGVTWTDWTISNETNTTAQLNPKNIVRTEFEDRLVEVSVSPDDWMYQRSSTDGGETWTQWKYQASHVEDGTVRFFHIGDKLFQVQKNTDHNNNVYFRYSEDGANWTGWNNTDLGTITGDYKADIVGETLVISGLNHNGIIYSRPIVNGVEQTRTNSSVASIADYEQEVIDDRIIQTYRGVDDKLYSRHSTDGVTWTDWTITNETNRTEQLHPKNIVRTEFENKLVEVSLSADNYIYKRYSTDGGQTWTQWKQQQGYIAEEETLRFFHVGDKLFQVHKNKNNHVYFSYSEDGANWTGWNSADLGTITGDYHADIVGETLVISGLNHNDIIYSLPIANGVKQTRTNSTVTTIADYKQEVIGDRIIQTYRGVDDKLYSRHSTDGIEWTDWTPIDNVLERSQWEQENVPETKTDFEAISLEHLTTTEFDDKLIQTVRDSRGYVYRRHSTDKGNTWTDWQYAHMLTQEDNARTIEVGDRLFQVWKYPNNHVYAYDSVDGVNWRHRGAVGGPSEGDYAISAIEDELVFAMRHASNNQVYTRTVNGQRMSNWDVTTIPTIEDIQQSVADDTITQTYVGVDNHLYTRQSTDGINWTEWQSPDKAAEELEAQKRHHLKPIVDRTSELLLPSLLYEDEELDKSMTLEGVRAETLDRSQLYNEQLAQVKAELAQNNAQASAAITQADWYERQAARHWQLSRKNGPTWTERRKTWKRGRSGKKKTHWVTITHVDHHWILWDTYTKYAQQLREQAVHQLLETDEQSQEQERLEPLAEQWANTLNAVNGAEPSLTASGNLAEQLEAAREQIPVAKEQLQVLEDLLPEVEKQFAQAQKEADEYNAKVLAEWKELEDNDSKYLPMVEDILEQRGELNRKSQELQHQLADVEQWVEWQTVALTTETEEVNRLREDLIAQRETLSEQIAQSPTDVDLQTKQAQLQKALTLLDNKATVLQQQQRAFSQKRTLLTAEHEVILAEQRLLDAYLTSPGDLEQLQKQLADARAALAEAQRLAEQAEASSQALTAPLQDVQADLLAQNDEHLRAAREHQQILRDLLEATELNANYTLQAAQKQREVNDLEFQIQQRLQEMISNGNKEAEHLLNVAKHNDMATAAEIYYRDYSDIASDTGGSCAGGIARPEDRALANRYYHEMMVHRQLQQRAQAQANHFGHLKRTAQAQKNALQARQDTAAKMLKEINDRIAETQEEREQKQQELAVARARLEGITRIREQTEQTFITLVNLEQLNLAQATLEQTIAAKRQEDIEKAVEERLEREAIELERQRLEARAKLEQLEQLQAEDALLQGVNAVRSEVGLDGVDGDFDPVQVQSQMATLLTQLEDLEQQQPDLPDNVKAALQQVETDLQDALQGKAQEVPRNNLISALETLILQGNTYQTELEQIAQEEALSTLLLGKVNNDLQEASREFLEGIDEANLLVEERKILTPVAMQTLANVAYAKNAVEISKDLAKEAKKLLNQIIDFRKQERKARKKYFWNSLISMAMTVLSVISLIAPYISPWLALGVALLQGAMGVISSALNGDWLGAIFNGVMAAASFVSGGLGQIIKKAGTAATVFGTKIATATLKNIQKGIDALRTLAKGAYDGAKSIMSGESILGVLQIIGSLAGAATTGLGSTIKNLPGGDMLFKVIKELEKTPIKIYEGIKAIQDGDWFKGINKILGAVFSTGKNLTAGTGPDCNCDGKEDRPSHVHTVFDLLNKANISSNVVVNKFIKEGGISGWLTGIGDLVGVWQGDLAKAMEKLDLSKTFQSYANKTLTVISKVPTTVNQGIEFIKDGEWVKGVGSILESVVFAANTYAKDTKAAPYANAFENISYTGLALATVIEGATNGLKELQNSLKDAGKYLSAGWKDDFEESQLKKYFDNLLETFKVDFKAADTLSEKYEALKQAVKSTFSKDTLKSLGGTLEEFLDTLRPWVQQAKPKPQPATAATP